MIRNNLWRYVSRASFLACIMSFILYQDFGYASTLRQHCNLRCEIRHAHCLEPGTLHGSEISSGTSCTGNCLDAYIQCDNTCQPNDNNCRNSCNTNLSSCTSGCNDADAACHSAYVGCRNSCSRMIACSHDAHCEAGNVCETGTGREPRCVARCTSNTQCQRRLGPAALCYREHCVLR